MAVKPVAVKPERRDGERHAVEVTMPVQVLRAENGRPLQCRIFDVSSDGLCVVSAEDLPIGTELVFVTLNQRVPLTVAWCRPDGLRQHRCGLRLVDLTSDLSAVFPGFLAKSSGD